MIIIRKKVLLSSVILFCFCYVSYSLIRGSYNDEPVVALPVSEKVIVIDAGHGR